MVLADTSGGYAYAARYKDYRAFGQMEDEEISLNLKYKYTGKPFDDEQMIEKMYYHGARYYLPGIKRWKSVDPKLGKYASWSPYAYALNNPLKYKDPDGRAVWAAVAYVIDAAPDAASLGLSVKDFVNQPSWENAGWVGLDLAAMIVPVWKAPGIIRHGRKLLKGGEKALDVSKGVENNAKILNATNKIGDAISITGKVETHHLLPKQFKHWFDKAGLSIDDYTIKMNAGDHRFKPKGIHTGSDNWNKQWQKFMAENPKAGKQAILDQLEKMKKDFGIKQ